MKNEADFKRVFKKSVKAQGGFALSLAAPMLAGIPDLYVVMPGYLPVLLEAKWLGEVNPDKFKRKVRYSPLQVVWIKECHSIVNYSALGLVGFRTGKRIIAALVPYDTEYFECITQNVLLDGNTVALTDGEFSVMSLFEQVPIPRLNNGPISTRRHIRPFEFGLMEADRGIEARGGAMALGVQTSA